MRKLTKLVHNLFIKIPKKFVQENCRCLEPLTRLLGPIFTDLGPIQPPLFITGGKKCSE